MVLYHHLSHAGYVKTTDEWAENPAGGTDGMSTALDFLEDYIWKKINISIQQSVDVCGWHNNHSLRGHP